MPISVHIVVQGADRAAAFYRDAFAAEELERIPVPDGRLMSVRLRIRGTVVHVADEFPDSGVLAPPSLGGTPVVLALEVSDAEAAFAQAVAAGATVRQPLHDAFWGDRHGQVQDPFGHLWNVQQHFGTCRTTSSSTPRRRRSRDALPPARPDRSARARAVPRHDGVRRSARQVGGVARAVRGDDPQLWRGRRQLPRHGQRVRRRRQRDHRRRHDQERAGPLGRRNEVHLEHGPGRPERRRFPPQEPAPSARAQPAAAPDRYVDLLWVHIWDAYTPVDEVVRGLDDLARAGKVLYVGISDTPAWIVARAVTLAEERGWTPFCALQVPYSLVERTVERELLPVARALDLAVTAWSPLGGGLLTGRYGSDRERPSDSRLAGIGGDYEREAVSERNLAIADVLNDVADERGVPASQVALAWVRAQQDRALTIPIVGVRTQAQLDDNLAAAGLTLGLE